MDDSEPEGGPVSRLLRILAGVPDYRSGLSVDGDAKAVDPSRAMAALVGYHRFKAGASGGSDCRLSGSLAAWRIRRQARIEALLEGKTPRISGKPRLPGPNGHVAALSAFAFWRDQSAASVASGYGID